MRKYCSKFVLGILLFTAPAISRASTDGALKVGPVKKGAALSGEGAIVLVNGQPISKAFYQYNLNKMMSQIKQNSYLTHGTIAEPNELMKKECLDQVIDLELLYQESKKQPPENLEEKVLSEFKKYKEAFSDEDAFAETLKNEGLTPEMLKDLYRRNISVENYINLTVAPQIVVTESEVQDFFSKKRKKFDLPEQVKASHILVKTGSSMSSEEKNKLLTRAQMVQKKAAAGEDFASLAEKFSEDENTRERGGDLGYFNRNRMPPTFGDAAFSLAIGGVSHVVETRYGYHVILVTDKTPPTKVKFEDVRTDLEAYLKRQRIDKKLEALLKQFRTGSEIISIHSPAP